MISLIKLLNLQLLIFTWLNYVYVCQVRSMWHRRQWGSEGLVWCWDLLFPQHSVRQVLQLVALEILWNSWSSRVSSVVLRIHDSLFHLHHIWQDFINSAQRPPSGTSDGQLSCLVLAWPTGWHQRFVYSHSPRHVCESQTAGQCPVFVTCGCTPRQWFSFGPFSAVSLVDFNSQCHISWRGHICVLVSLFVRLYWKILPKSYGFPWLEVSIW